MTNNLNPNIPNLLLLIDPNHFGYNTETSGSNHFQQIIEINSLKEQVSKTFEHVVTTLNENGISNVVFQDGTTILPDAVFPNNWISSLPSGTVTIFPMLARNRRAEVREDIIKWVMEKTGGEKLIDLTAEVSSNKFLEGTGSIVFDHSGKVAYACESERTAISLFEAYCEMIGYQPLSFESLDLNGFPIYHTNVMMSIAEKYCLINLDSIQNVLERSFCKNALEKSGKVIIPLSYAQMSSFAANVLEVRNSYGESCLVMSTTAYNSLNEGQLKEIKKFSKIVQVNVEKIEKIGGGGIRCMLAGLFAKVL